MGESTLPERLAELRGVAVSPSEPDYDEARAIWNGTIDRKPSLIVRCQGVADVIDAVNYAREAALPVSVRVGGHHVAGSSLIEGGLVIDLSQMRAVRVDPATASVRAEGGAQIGDLDRETQAFGLAVPLGVVSKTGIAGLTLGGGLGWLRRKYGYSSDNLVSMDVVTADGTLVTASENENIDLFWALRGGGWDLGVVTSFEFRAYPLGPEVMLAFIAYPIEDAKQVLSRVSEWARSAPEELSPICVFWTFPESEEFPRELWGRQFIAVAGPYAGSVADGESAIAPLRELGTPLLDMSGPMPFRMIQQMFDADYPDGRRYYWKSTYLRTLDDATIDTLVEIGSNRPSPLTSLDVWLLGGQLARVGSTDTPIAERDAGYLVGIESNWDEADEDAANIKWARDAEQSLTPYSTGASYLNFEDLSDSEAVAASHGANHDRLVSVKRQFDPANLFRSRGGLID